MLGWSINWREPTKIERSVTEANDEDARDLLGREEAIIIIVVHRLVERCPCSECHGSASVTRASEIMRTDLALGRGF